VTSLGSWLFVAVFYVLPLVLLFVTVTYWGSNLFALIGLLTWMGIGFLMNAAVLAEGREA